MRTLILLLTILLLVSSCGDCGEQKKEAYPKTDYYIEVFFADGAETTISVKSVGRPFLDNKSCLHYYPKNSYSSDIIATHVKLIKITP